MMMYPDVQKAAQEEIDRVIGPERLTERRSQIVAVCDGDHEGDLEVGYPSRMLRLMGN